MPTLAKLGYGSLLKKGNGASPEVFNTIAEVMEVSGFGAERALIEVTNFDSANSFREYIAGMKDGVQFTIKATFLPNTTSQDFSTGLGGDFEAGTAKNFKLIMTGTLGTFTFAALVLGWKPDTISPTGAITATFTFKVTGSISYAAG